MSALLPVALYGLKVPAGDVMVPALNSIKSTFRLTMAAIDPSKVPEKTKDGAPPRATLKIIFDPDGPDSDDDEDDEEFDRVNLGLEDDDLELSSSDDEDTNGGPSDPARSKKARKEAAADQTQKILAENGVDTDDEMDVDGSPKTNGLLSKKRKGKGRATEGDEGEESSEEEADDESDLEAEEMVICTLDPSKNFQQPLDIVVGEDQTAYFKVSGDYDIYLTGNYAIDPTSSESMREPEYDLDPDEDEFEEELSSDEESDELDDLEDPRITELESEDEAPKLIKASGKSKTENKGKNKRAAEESSDEEAATLDDIMAKSLKPEEPAVNGEPKLSKKQLKKLKNNAGKAVEATAEDKGVKEEDKADKSSVKGDKKVQFAKNLEQGPTGKSNGEKADTKSNLKGEENKKETAKSALGVKTVQGVKIDDRKLGKGPAAKKGDKVGLRYIGKLDDGKVFDANKSGKPFQFTLGSGEVIKGWDIGVSGMTVGGERRITIPSHLAYGSKAQPKIPANSTLTFDLKMITLK